MFPLCLFYRITLHSKWEHHWEFLWLFHLDLYWNRILFHAWYLLANVKCKMKYKIEIWNFMSISAICCQCSDWNTINYRRVVSVRHPGTVIRYHGHSKRAPVIWFNECYQGCRDRHRHAGGWRGNHTIPTVMFFCVINNFWGQDHFGGVKIVIVT